MSAEAAASQVWPHRRDRRRRTPAIWIYELAVILPLLGWFTWSFLGSPGQVSDPLLLEWVVARALPSGVLAEQIHPYTGDPLSVSPLTWSHAAFVETVQQYLTRLASLSRPFGG